MNIKKRVLAAVAAAGMLASVAAYAEEAVLISEAPEAAEAMVNGMTLTGVEVKADGDIAMMPLREVAEGFGYTVNWNDADWSIELIKGASYITMEIGEDAYAFSRMAHRPLGKAPTLIDDKTYVPLAFAEEILGGYAVAEEEGTYKFVSPSIVTVVGFTEEGSLKVSDEARGTVIVHISEETEIFAGDKEVEASEIKEGMILGVEYGMAMTMSLPPQTTAERIILKNVEIAE